MLDIRRIIIIFVIALLFTILFNVSIDAFYQPPAYEDFCRGRYPIAKLEIPQCNEFIPSPEIMNTCKGTIEYKYDDAGCPIDAYCDNCGNEFNQANEKYTFVVFVVSAILGLIALGIGLHLPQESDVNMWIGSGFLLGGLITILVGTVRHFGDMGRYMKPIVIGIELALVIFLTYKKLGKK